MAVLEFIASWASASELCGSGWSHKEVRFSPLLTVTRACMHAHTHTHMQACIMDDAWDVVCMYACMRACARVCVHACMHVLFLRPWLWLPTIIMF